MEIQLPAEVDNDVIMMYLLIMATPFFMSLWSNGYDDSCTLIYMYDVIMM